MTSPSVILALVSSGDPLLPLVETGLLFVDELRREFGGRGILVGTGGGALELVRSRPVGRGANCDFDRGRLGMREGGNPLTSPEVGCGEIPSIGTGGEEGPAVADVSTVNVCRGGANVDFVRLRGEVGIRLTATEVGGTSLELGKGTDAAPDDSEGAGEGESRCPS